jgi:hypothetical protein
VIVVDVPLEESLRVAWADGDVAGCLALLRAAQFGLPMTERAALGDEPPAWPTVDDGERVWVVAYTSAEAPVFSGRRGQCLAVPSRFPGVGQTG